MSSRNKWLFIVPDTDAVNNDMSPYMATIMDGDNVAFAYNTSNPGPLSSCKVSGASTIQNIWILSVSGLFWRNWERTI